MSPARSAASRPSRPGPRTGFGLASLGSSPSVLLARAAAPGAALVAAAAMAGAAALAGRPPREVGLVAGTVLVGQVALGWAHALTWPDPEDPAGRPRPDRGTLWFALTCAVLVVVPLAVASGRLAAGAYLGALLVLAVGDRLLGATPLSFLPWAVGIGLLPAFLAYGGWAGTGSTTPPTVTMTVLAAALGVCIHVLRSLPGLVQAHQRGRRSLPLLLALRTGTPRLLLLTRLATAAVVGGLLIAGRTVGLT